MLVEMLTSIAGKDSDGKMFDAGMGDILDLPNKDAQALIRGKQAIPARTKPVEFAAARPTRGRRKASAK